MILTIKVLSDPNLMIKTLYIHYNIIFVFSYWIYVVIVLLGREVHATHKSKIKCKYFSRGRLSTWNIDKQIKRERDIFSLLFSVTLFLNK